jgi:hypothetical protein
VADRSAQGPFARYMLIPCCDKVPDTNSHWPKTTFRPQHSSAATTHSFGPAHPTEQRVYVGPELLPLLAFLVRQSGECVPVTDAGQVGIALRVLADPPADYLRATGARLGPIATAES